MNDGKATFQIFARLVKMIRQSGEEKDKLMDALDQMANEQSDPNPEDESKFDA